MKSWLQLIRVSNLPTVWTNVIAAWMLAGGSSSDVRLAWLLLAGSLLYSGGMILNDAADVKFDREHRRERPISSGKVDVQTAWIVGVVMPLLGSGLAAGSGANPRVTAILCAAIVFYDLYHKQWAGSVIVMGACRTLLYLMAASAASADVLKALPAALALGAYIVGITLAARLEHRKAKLPLLMMGTALILLYMPGLVFVRQFATGLADPWQLVILAAFALLVAYATQTMRQGGPAIGKAVGILLAGIAVVDALAVASVSIQLALAFVALTPVLRVWQRWIAAT